MSRPDRRLLLLPVLSAALLLTACGGGSETPPEAPAPPPQASGAPTTPAPGSASPTPSGPAAPRLGDVEPILLDVATGIETPWGLARTEDGLLLASERDTGRIVALEEGQAPREVVEVPDVSARGEGGLLGIAVGPETLYAYATTDDDNRVLAWDFDGTAVSGQPRVLLSGIPKGTIHNGGRLALGPDGMLWISTGEGGEEELSQDTGSLGGKILRLNPDGSVPGDNPFGNPVWSYGHRNVQGLAFDDRGRLWATEFGQQRRDELNLIARGGNYGWPLVEGDEEGGPDGAVAPQLTWSTSAASPSGLAAHEGRLWMANLRGESLMMIDVSGEKAEQERVWYQGRFGRIRTTLSTPDGLYVSTSNTDGRGSPERNDDRVMVLRTPV